jgi:environmental stress-induced protein Ves
MKKRIYKEENYKTSKWSGGNTRELAIYPANAEYLDRDFLRRLSSADSDLEESSFTKLPDYDRILMVLEGSVVLAHGDERTASLDAFAYDEFDGAVKTKCFGKLIKDYNLIYRKGCKGRRL